MREALDKYAIFAASEDAFLTDAYAVNLMCLARLAYKQMGYLVDDHTYLPQWLITEPLNDISSPKPLDEAPEEP